MSFKARRMVAREFPSDEAFTARCPEGKLLHFCVEHESGKIVPSLSWTQAVAEATRLNEEAAVTA